MDGDRSKRYELRLERVLDASRANVWRCWREPKLLEQWFAPEGWTTEVKALEQRPVVRLTSSCVAPAARCPRRRRVLGSGPGAAAGLH
jgi:uncharacterized protein YndB with AHSA1/START domain